MKPREMHMLNTDNDIQLINEAVELYFTGTYYGDVA
jgi:hypothetical protein